jgi:hypothetical protein
MAPRVAADEPLYIMEVVEPAAVVAAVNAAVGRNAVVPTGPGISRPSVPLYSAKA